jgi:hypothetical protein
MYISPIGDIGTCIHVSTYVYICMYIYMHICVTPICDRYRGRGSYPYTPFLPCPYLNKIVVPSLDKELSKVS